MSDSIRRGNVGAAECKHSTSKRHRLGSNLSLDLMPPPMPTSAEALDATPTMPARSTAFLQDAPPPPVPANRPGSDTVALTCGLEYESLLPWDESSHTSAAPYFLPTFAPNVPPPDRRSKSTGCGAPVHAGASVSHGWRAPAAGASPTVIPLDTEYFVPAAARVLKLGACGPCGCRMDGVGCRICGNALGAKYAPCAAHAGAAHSVPVYSFLPAAVSPPLPLLLPASAAPPSSARRASAYGAPSTDSPTTLEFLRALHAMQDDPLPNAPALETTPAPGPVDDRLDAQRRTPPGQRAYLQRMWEDVERRRALLLDGVDAGVSAPAPAPAREQRLLPLRRRPGAEHILPPLDRDRIPATFLDNVPSPDADTRALWARETGFSFADDSFPVDPLPPAREQRLSL
ncbi:hypothetical protein FB451DRAFT_1563906 [Mycena latifolia]|nr:hypothetical protein FB451DRAFT_1563906 [Mycena latifolia]